MSYDIYLAIDTGGEHSATVAEVGNYTSNVAPMWRRALGCSLADLHGTPAADAIPVLERAVADMAVNPGPYKEMEPSNGWGDYDGAFGYLHRLLDLCREHPRTTIEVSY